LTCEVVEDIHVAQCMLHCCCSVGPCLKAAQEHLMRTHLSAGIGCSRRRGLVLGSPGRLRRCGATHSNTQATVCTCAYA
jgi:hypothetical protein